MSIIFRDRAQAGRYLAEVVREEGFETVFGIARGGVVVAQAIAEILKVPVEVVAVRKLGVPFSPELAFGAIAPGGVLVLDHAFMERVGLSTYEIESISLAEEEALKKRVAVYGIKKPQIEGKSVLLVDDGVATGATAQAGIRYLKKFNPSRIAFASPVCAPESVAQVRKEADIICLKNPENFLAVGQFYEQFEPVSDEEVVKLVKEGNAKL